jgi:hypothetical protein
MSDTIHDAIDALFAQKAAELPPTPPPETPPADPPPGDVSKEAEKSNTSGEHVDPANMSPETPADGAAPEGEQPPEDKPEEKPPEQPKTSAADYALQLSRAKKKLAAAEAKASAAQPPPKTPSEEALQRAAALEAAGADPLKRFEAAGLDLAEVVKAFDAKLAEDPDSGDPLAKKVKELESLHGKLVEKLSLYEKREQEAEDAKAESSFLASAETMAKGSDDFETVAAFGSEGLELVKQLVLEAHAGNPEKGIAPRVMPVAEALKEAEAYYRAIGTKLAKTKWLAKLLQTTTTKKPGIGSGGPPAPPAPKPDTTKPTTVQDVINQEIDALLGSG